MENSLTKINARAVRNDILEFLEQKSWNIDHGDIALEIEDVPKFRKMLDIYSVLTGWSDEKMIKSLRKSAILRCNQNSGRQGLTR